MKKLLFTFSGAWLALYAASCSPDPNPSGNGSLTTGGTSNGTGSSGNGSGSATGTGGLTQGAGGGAGASTGTGGLNQGTGGLNPGAGGNGNDGSGGSAPVDVDRPELVTSGVDNFWVEGTLAAGAGQANVTVDVSTAGARQVWHGFGGTFNEAGWATMAFLTQAEIDQAIRWLFSPAEGANFKWGRIPIGASDYALERYTLNESEDDFDMSEFSIAHDETHLIPYVKAAQAVKNDILFWGSPWTPPRWMKTTEEYNGTDEGPNGDPPATYEAYMKDDAMTLQAHALYFARWIQAYEAQGIPIDHVQPQNEPGYDTRYPSCLWEAGLLGTFVGQYLGPTLESEGLSTDIWFGTLSNDSVYAGHIGGLTGAAAGYVTGVGLQWNTREHVGTLAGQGYLVMNTEHKCGNYPWLTAMASSATDANRDNFLAGTAPNNHAYGEETWDEIKLWLDAGVNVYSAWNMVLNTDGQNLDEARPWPQNALLVVDEAARTIRRTAAYWVFRHLSYYVDPGATRLAVTGNALAFRNLDQSIVAVVHNPNNSPAPTTLAAGERTVQFDIPARGWASVLLEN